MRDLSSLPARIAGDQDRADLGQAEPSLEELGPVLEHEGHPITFPNAQLVPGAGGHVDPAIELTVGDALLPMDEKRLVWNRTRCVLQKIAHVQRVQVSQRA